MEVFVIMEITSWLITIVSISISIYYGQKSTRLEKEVRSYDWYEIMSAVTIIYRKMIKAFKPTIIFAPCLRGGIVAELFLSELGEEIPVFMGMAFTSQYNKSAINLSGFSEMNTRNWSYYLPDAIFDIKNPKILIIDDFSHSGETLNNLKKIFISKGINSNNVKTMCLAVTNVAIQSNNPPDFYYYTKNDDNFYFPWGKANRWIY